MGDNNVAKVIVAIVLIVGGIAALFLITGCGKVAAIEVESGPIEIWYRGEIINTTEGVYFLSWVNRDIMAIGFDFYPHNSATDYSSMTIFYRKRFMIGNQLYRLIGVESDNTTVELLEDDRIE